MRTKYSKKSFLSPSPTFPNRPFTTARRLTHCNCLRIYQAMVTTETYIAHSSDGGTKTVSSFSKVGFHHIKSPRTVGNLVLLFLWHLRITTGIKTLLNHQKACSDFSIIDWIIINHKTECRNAKRRTYVWSYPSG